MSRLGSSKGRFVTGVTESPAAARHAGGLKPAASTTKPATAGCYGREPASAGLVSVAAGFILRRVARRSPPCGNIRHTHWPACLPSVVYWRGLRDQSIGQLVEW